MKITTITGRELDNGLAERWTALQRANSSLASPYFHPEFTSRLAGVKANVEVSVIEDERGIVGFFPFDRGARSVGGPVGGVLSDYHGLVSAREIDLDPLDLLRGARLAAWDYSHLPVSQSLFPVRSGELSESPQIDLRSGYTAYATRKRSEGSGLIDRAAYLERRLAREVGPVRFEAQAVDPAALDQVIAWKSAQYAKTGRPDIFRLPWTTAALKAIQESRNEGFAGVLSALYVGDRLVSGHFGMRSHSAWHYWFPAYDPVLARYSPGLILVLKMAESAPRLGLDFLDLGGGAAPYKMRLATGSVLLSAGSVERSKLRGLRRGARSKLAHWVRNSPIESSVRALLNQWPGRDPDLIGQR